MKDYETIEHTADIGIRSFGKDEKESFENAAVGMFSLLCDLEKVGEGLQFPVEVQAEDHETLLVEWLNELLYIFESDGVLLKRFHVAELGETHLRGVAFGELIDSLRHEIKTDIKAVTYYQLKVERTDGGWKAEVIFDV